jgi:hypothetical protein
VLHRCRRRVRILNDPARDSSASANHVASLPNGNRPGSRCVLHRWLVASSFSP